MKDKQLRSKFAIPSILLFISLLFLTGCPDQWEPPQAHWIVVGANGAIRISYDDGLTWQEANSGTTNTLYSVATDVIGNWMATNNHVSGKTPISDIAVSNDSGENWNQAGLNIQNHFLLGIGAEPGGLVIAVGGYTNGNGDIWYSQDLGSNWHQVNGISAYGTLRGVATDNKGRWVAVGDNSTIIWSDQPSNQWQSATIHNSPGSHGDFKDVAYIGKFTSTRGDFPTWILVGGNNNSQTRLLYRSFDNGLTWYPLDRINQPAEAGKWLRAIAANRNGYCIIGGDKGSMWISDNYGETWYDQNLPQFFTTSEDISDIAFNGDHRWMATLYNGKANSGDIIWFDDNLSVWSWNRVDTGSRAWLNGVAYGY